MESRPHGSESEAVIANGAKLVGETFVPGASLLLDGEVKNGVAHALAGLGARMMLGSFGPLGMLVVAVDSYSKSVTDKYLVEHVTDGVQVTRGRGTSSAADAG